MNGRSSDASTSTDDLKDRPLCLFYFTHPFGVLSPEPPTLAAAPAHVARAFLNMEPVSPLHFWPSSDAYAPDSSPSSAKLSFDLGDAKVHKNPVNLVSVKKTRKCTIDLSAVGRETLSSSLLSSDIWFSSGSSTRSYEYTRRLIPYNRILPPLRLPAPADTSTADSADELWPLRRVARARVSLPPIQLPAARAGSAAGGAAEAAARPARARRVLGVRKPRLRARAARRSAVRRLLTRLTQRAVKGRTSGSSSSPALRRALAVLRDAWPEPRSLFDLTPRHSRTLTRMSYTRQVRAADSARADEREREHEREHGAASARAQLAELPPRPGASPGLLRRRYSVPETIMRKYRLAQQRSESEQSGQATSPSPASATGSPGRGCESCGSASLCEPQRSARRDRELMRKSALLRRLWGRAGGGCGCAHCDARETRSLDTSRSELRHLSGSFASSRHSHAAGWASPKRQRLDFRGSEEMLRAAMRNSYDRAEESRCEKAAAERVECSDTTCHFRHETSSYIETTDALTDSESKYDAGSDNNASTRYSERLSSDAATAEVRSELHTDAADSEHSASHAQMDDHSFTDTSDTFSTSMSTAKEANGNSKFAKQISKSAHIDGRISERSGSVDNDENNILPYDTPLTVETPAYELLEIVVSETLNNPMPAIKSNVPENTSTQTLKAPTPNYRLPPNMNIDEYVSNILVESLNSLTDQLECMNASIGNDCKINIVEKEIKVKLQNTGVNTIVHLSPTSNNQIIFGNEELYNSEERKDSCNNVPHAHDAVTIREELVSVESNNNLTPAARDQPGAGGARLHSDRSDRSDQSNHSALTAPYYDEPFNSLHHESVNHAVLQQIQKLFQDELQNLDSDINFQVGSIPGVSHIEISNVDVFLDNNADAILGNSDTIEVHTQNGVEISEIISGVGTGNYYEEVENNVVVPRFSAFPNTDSMEVNTSSSDDAEIIGSDCTSLVDSLDDPNSPRSILLRRSFNNNSQKRSELVRSAIDVLDLLPENSSREDSGHPKEKGEAFFIRIKDDDCDCEKENVIVADHMPEKIKQRLYRRHRKRELRMECARRSKVKQLKRELERQRHAERGPARRELERDAHALVAALVDDVIAKIAHDEYKCMRVKQRPAKIPMSKSDENVSRRTWRKDTDYQHSKELFRNSKNGSKSFIEKPTKGKKSDRHHIHGKLSLLTHPTSPSSEDRGPKRIYQKSEIHEGNKCIEILEILEYVNGSQSSPETTNSDENHNHRSKKSRIPVPVYERIPKTPKSYSQKAHYASAERLTSPPVPRERSKKQSNSLANMLMEVLADDEESERAEPAEEAPAPAARRASVPHCEPRSRSNSLRFRRVFDSIPEERTSLSIDSSNEDFNHNRRASAPTLVDNLNSRLSYARNCDAMRAELKGEEPVRSNQNLLRTSKETKSAGTSPLADSEPEKRAQRLKSQMTMTSPSRKSAATSPIHSTSHAAASPGGAAAGPGAPPAASGKRGLASRSPAWLGFTRPDSSKLEEGSKEMSVELDAQRERKSAGTQCDRERTAHRTVRTIQTETSDPVIVGGDRGRDDARVRARTDDLRRREAKPKRTDRTKSESRDRRAAEARDDAGPSPGRRRDSDFAVRTTDKRKIRTISVERSEEETVRTKSVKLPEFGGGRGGGGGASSSDSSDSGGSLLCSLAPKWLSSHARHRRGPRRRDAAPASPPPAASASTPTTADQHSAGGWSVTVAGSCRAALPADLEMRLRFPHERAAPHAPPLARALRSPDKRQQECPCGACARAGCACACACAPPLPPAPPHAAHLAHPDAGKLKLTMKKEALDSSILASKSMKKSSDPLPDLETFRASRSKTKSSVKTRRGYSLHCWLPDDEPAPMRTSNGLSVLGCAIIPELKPRVPTMSERDLTRAYTPRHYLRS